MKLSSGKNSTTLILIALVAALLFAVYYYVVLPKKNEEEMLVSSINQLRAEITTLQEEVASTGQATTTSNEFMLRKKVPATRAIDQLILNVEEIEYLTNSRILSINFNNYDSLVSQSGLAPTSEENSNNQVVEDEASTDELTSTIAIESLPSSLKMITVQVSVESPNYIRLQRFIKELESLDRTMHIDSISYSLMGEELEFEGTSEVVEATLQFTTFYQE